MAEVNAELHKNTKYRLPRIHEQFAEAKDRVASLHFTCRESGWNGYNADPVDYATTLHTLEVLDALCAWFEKHIGFFNNRGFKISVWPWPCGSLHIEMEYDLTHVCDVFVSTEKAIDLVFRPRVRYILDGKHTIADRHVDMVWAKDALRKKCTVKGIDAFLTEAFYKHKWNSEITSKDIVE